jgi:hemerythrin-like domain-containing protein
MITTESLIKEHQLILKYVDLMERYTKTSIKNSNTTILLENANFFIQFIHEFADHFHHSKEEDILFRYLDVPGVLTHCNPIPQMIFEHNKARELVCNMEKAIHKKELNELMVNADQYANLLKSHIFKEDNILYPLAERGLPDEAKLSLLNEYTETDNRLNSRAIWSKFENLYTELEKHLKAKMEIVANSCEHESQITYEKGQLL